MCIRDSTHTSKQFGKDQPDILSVDQTISKLSPFHTSSFLFKSEHLELPAWFFEVVSSDMALFSIIAKRGKLAKINEVMSIYRKQPGGITNTIEHKKRFHQHRIHLIEKLDEYHDFKYTEQAQQVIQHHKKMIHYKPSLLTKLKIGLKNLVQQVGAI